MKRPIFSSTERDAMVGVLRGAGAAALAASAALLGAALATYDPSDPGAYTSTWRAATNLLGAPGAFVSDFLMRAIGYASFGIVCVGAVWAARLGLRRLSPGFALDLLAAPIAVILLAGFASSHDAAAPFGGGYGGLIGDTVFGVLAHAVPLAEDRARFVAATLLLAAMTAFMTMIALGGRPRDLAALVAEALRRWRLLGAWVLDGLAAWALDRRLGPDPGYASASAGGLDAPITLGPQTARRRARGDQAGQRREPGFSDAADPQPRADAAYAAGGAGDDGGEPGGVFAWTRPDAPTDAAPEADWRDADAHDDIDDHVRPRRPSRSLGAAASEAIARAKASAARAQARERAKERAWRRESPDREEGGAEPPFGDEDVASSHAAAAADRAAARAAETQQVTNFAPASFGAAWRPDIDLTVSLTPAAAAIREITLDAPTERTEPTVDAPPQSAAAPGPEPSQTARRETPPEPSWTETVSEPPVAPQAAQEDDEQEESATGYRKPSLELLADADSAATVRITEQSLAEQADRLQAVLHDYGVRGEIIDVNPGPVVSQFELEPAPGLKASRVIGLAEDVARSMSAVAARISTIPGRNVIGVELPNEERETVLLRPLLEDPSFADASARLPLALGRDIAGAPIVADLAAMPHLLIAGTTGSGKSVAINTMILSLLFQKTPEEVRLILIDPKMLELSVYNETPHLLSPVVTDPKQAVRALRWVVREMERRYQRMAQLNVRSIDSYNQKVAEAAASGEQFERAAQIGFDETTGEPIYDLAATPLERLPLIVVVIDEMADLMLVAGKEIEHCIQRLAQMARASGIHLVMATQRPSVDVITGVIKANFPIRISFQVTSKIDSRTILGENGAEQLLGKGDMLFTAGGGRLQRIHGPFASDQDVETVVAYLRRFGAADDLVSFDEEAGVDAPAAAEEAEGDGDESGDEALYERAVKLVAKERRASTSFLQRRLQLGYNRAARIVEMMEQRGIVSPANHVGKREILIDPSD